MAKDWIAGAIKHPGSLTAKAKKAKAVTKKGTIKAGWLSKVDEGSGATAKQARLAEMLRRFGKRK